MEERQWFEGSKERALCTHMGSHCRGGTSRSQPHIIVTSLKVGRSKMANFAKTLYVKALKVRVAGHAQITRPPKSDQRIISTTF